ncbi:hypothetical protein [Hoeflea sp.]|uniref:hypothetical protein n=1 Tax=Hoeflea sp. TaxID=1940281 RepID=UPI002B001CF5|nr:hypothetical protein [Hoeflea sp.]
MSQIHSQTLLLPAEPVASPKELMLIDVTQPPARVASGQIIAGSVRPHPFGAEQWASGYGGRAVAVYCVHGQEVSQVVCGVLRDQGVAAVGLACDFEAWKDAGLAVEPVEATDA